YGAPTPLVDFTYSLDVALYFATEFCVHKDGANRIEQYFSVTAIDRRFQENEFLNITQFHQGTYPKISSFYDFQKDNNSVFYVSDFESYPGKKSQGFQNQRPLTILFNQR